MKINLVTGATGFIGRRLVHELLLQGEYVWIIVRVEIDKDLEGRRKKEIFTELKNKYPDKFKIIEGDVAKNRLEIGKFLESLHDYSLEIWHLAANLSFVKKEKKDIYKTNVEGTRNIVKLANKYSARLYYMSTAYVCGNSKEHIKEDKLIKGTRFRNNYEKTKYLAEKIVRKESKNYIIFRSSIVIGDGYEGKAKGCTFGYYRFSYVFYVFKNWLDKKGWDKSKLRIPIFYPSNSEVNFVSLSYVINTMLEISQKDKIKNKTFHLINPNPPKFIFLFKILMNDLGFNNVIYIKIPKFIFVLLIKKLYYIFIPYRKYIESANWYLPYIVKDYKFSTENLKLNNINFHPKITREFMNEVNKNAINKVFCKIK